MTTDHDLARVRDAVLAVQRRHRERRRIVEQAAEGGWALTYDGDAPAALVALRWHSLRWSDVRALGAWWPRMRKPDGIR